MADRYTTIRGNQILDLTITNDDIAAAAAIALSKLAAGSDAQIVVANGSGVPTYVAMSGDVTIDNTGATAIGADKVTKTEIAADVAGNGLAQAAGGELDLDLNELTGAAVDVSADSIAIVDATDSSSKKESIADLVTAIAGSGLTATNGVLSVDAQTGNVVLESDVINNETPSGDINGANTDFTLANTPETGTVTVYLRGLRQANGSGKDYTISGTTITFATAPESGDWILVDYIKQS